MYPKFDQKNHWYSMKCVYHTGYYLLLPAFAVLLPFMKIPWVYILMVLYIWFIVMLVSDYRLMHVHTRRTEMNKKIFYCKLITRMSDSGWEYIVQDKDSPLFENEVSKDKYMRWCYLIGCSENKIPCVFQKFCSEEKEDSFRRLVNKYLVREHYPLYITYYKKNNLVYRIDLVDGEDYSEDFVKEFYALCEMF